MSSSFDAKAFQERLQQLDSLLREAEQAADPAARTRLQQIVQALLELHGTALDRLLARLDDAGAPGHGILESCAQDDVVSGLLLLHGLHPHDVDQRVRHALDSVRPYLRSHGGNVELLEIQGEIVRLRLEGSCHHCPSSSVTMQQTIEEAIYARAPEITAIELDGALETVPALEDSGARVALPLV
jgi:Fe-S cluster biogenesis protein NfuA